MTTLRFGLDRLPDADGTFNISIRDVVLWRLLRQQLAHVGIDEMRDALRSDGDVFAPQLFGTEYLVDGVYSREGYQFNSMRVHGRRWHAQREDYEELLKEWNSKPRPPVAVLDVNEVALTPAPVTVRVLNEGFGGPEALEIESIRAPTWTCVEFDGRELGVRSSIANPGVYHGVVEVITNGGTTTLVVTAERLDFQPPASDFVTIDTFFSEVEGLEVAETRARVEAYLTDLGFEMLPGGSAVQKKVRPTRVDTIRVRLKPTYVAVGEVPIPHPVDPEPKLVDEDGHDPSYSVSYSNGILSGLRELFVDYEASVGDYLVLQVLADGYRFSLEPPNLLLETRGYRYWLLGSIAELESIPDWKQLMHTWVGDGEVNVLVRDWIDSAFAGSLEQLHQAGVITVKRFDGALPAVIVIEADDELAIDPFRGNVVELSTDIGFLWRRGELLDGRDVREEAQTSATGEGLTLPLTPVQRRLAESLRPMPKPSGSVGELVSAFGMLAPGIAPPEGSGILRMGSDGWGFTQRETLLSLMQLGNDYLGSLTSEDGGFRIAPARSLLERHGLTAGQVNYFERESNPISITVGGWITRSPTSMSLTQLAASVVALMSEPLHHSQLRQICEAFLGNQIDPTSFLQASLRACGWAGPGYRRAWMKNDPAGTNLQDVVRSLIRMGHMKRYEVAIAARKFLRVKPERILQAYDDVVRETHGLAAA